MALVVSGHQCIKFMALTGEATRLLLCRADG